MDLSNEKVSSFLRSYHVRVPSNKGVRHNPVFVRGALENIDKILELQLSSDPDIVGTLEELRSMWGSIYRKIGSETAREGSEQKAAERPAKFDFRIFCAEHNITLPNSAGVTCYEDVSQEMAKIQDALNGVRVKGWEGVEIPKHKQELLTRWLRGWKAVGYRYKQDFGTVDERKGPPAKYLAKKKAKAEVSRQAMNKNGKRSK